MYEGLFAVFLISIRVGFACGYVISPNSYPLLDADHLAAQRLNWQTPISTKEDQSMVLNVCGTSECNGKHSNMLPSLMISRQLTDKRLLNFTTVFSSRDWQLSMWPTVVFSMTRTEIVQHHTQTPWSVFHTPKAKLPKSRSEQRSSTTTHRRPCLISCPSPSSHVKNDPRTPCLSDISSGKS